MQKHVMGKIQGKYATTPTGTLKYDDDHHTRHHHGRHNHA